MNLRLHRLTQIFIVLALFCCAATIALAQGTSSSLTGQITDSKGASIVGATVTATNVGTGLVESAKTSGEGVYRISPLPPGSYSLSVEAPGFVHYVQNGIVLTVAFAATQNVSLKPGSVSQTVSVTSGTPLIDTTTSQLGMTVNAESVTQLPLNGRDPSSLVFLAPGIIPDTRGNSYSQSGFSFPTEVGAAANGGRQGSVYYLLDGVPNMDTYLGLPAPFPNADATQEFRVISNNFNASYGFAPGGVVTIETKSGTNSFHGGAFDFVRNQDLNASNWFSHQLDTLKRSQFGAFIGGPILKDKLFLFLNYQGTRSTSASSANHSQTPTAAMYLGDFSGLSPDGVTETLNAPFAKIGGKPNQINPALFNQTAVTVAKATLPLGGSATDGTGPLGGVFYSTAPTVNNYNEGTGRVDFNASPSQRLSLVSYVNDFIQPSGDIPGNILSILNLNTWQMTLGEEMQYYNEALHHTWTINPTTVNQLSVFWTQMAAHSASAAETSNNQSFCWSKYINVAELPGSCYTEGFSANNGFNVGFYEPSQEERTTYGIYDNFTKILGRHTVEFGLNIQHQFAEEVSQFPTQPILGFNGSYTNNGLADLLMGDLQNFEQGAGEVADVAGWQPGFYAQDQFQLRPNITITAGLRWDPNFAPQIKSGRAATFVAGEQSTEYPNSPLGLVFPGDKGVSGGLMRNTYGYWEPRVGLSWQPKALPSTSVHAGFGLFTQPMIYSDYNHTADSQPFAPTYVLDGTATTPLNLNSPWTGNAGTGGVSPFPPFASASFRPPTTATFTTGGSMTTIEPNFKLGVTESWNVGVDQQLGRNTVLNVAYVGSQGYHQSIALDLNPGIYATGGSRSSYPLFGQILANVSPATFSYESLQAMLERKLSHGLQLQSSFTWSKTTDIASSSNLSFGNQALGDPFDLSWSRGTSSQDIPLVWVTNFVYTTPSLRGHNILLQEALGKWEVSGIYTMSSGDPFSVSGGFGNNQSEAQQGGDRADVVPGVSLKVRQGSRSQWLLNYFNINAFKENAPGTFGTSRKNIMFGPPQDYGDAGLDKNWSITQKTNLQFRWEMFNVFNHPLFGTPNAGNQIKVDGTNNGGNEGQITSGGFEPSRVMQGALKFTF